MTTVGENRDRYSTTIETAPSRFTEPDAYAAWLARADEWSADKEAVPMDAAEAPTRDWTVSLTPSKRSSAGMRHVRVINCDAWDDALLMAENAHPGWDALQAGPFVAGTGLTFEPTINASATQGVTA